MHQESRHLCLHFVFPSSVVYSTRSDIKGQAPLTEAPDILDMMGAWVGKDNSHIIPALS